MSTEGAKLVSELHYVFTTLQPFPDLQYTYYTLLISKQKTAEQEHLTNSYLNQVKDWLVIAI